jgi:hypothetical protein
MHPGKMRSFAGKSSMARMLCQLAEVLAAPVQFYTLVVHPMLHGCWEPVASTVFERATLL